MPATLTRIEPALFSDLKAGNERALERLFRERYDEFLTEGRSLLDGDGASAARAIERVFVEAWMQHEEIPTVEALEAYLHEALHEAAARIRSRHTVAHHLGEYEGGHAQKTVPRPPPGVDDAWAAVSGALHVDASQTAALAQKAAEHSRHVAAGHLAEIAKPRSRWPMIAIALLLVGASVGFVWWVTRAREATVLTARLAATDTRSMTTAEGQLSNVTLAERSTVKLGPVSKLIIPRGFGASIRGLKLEGTATFTVAPDQKRPFTVRAGNVSVVATGTAFTVRAYPDERDVTISVREGDVTVTANDSVRRLTTGAALVVSSDGTMREPTAAEIEEAIGWAEGTVLVSDRPLREIIAAAKRWFALDLFVADTKVLDRTATLRAPIGSPSAAIASIETSGGVEQVWKGPNMVLRDREGRRR